MSGFDLRQAHPAISLGLLSEYQLVAGVLLKASWNGLVAVASFSIEMGRLHHFRFSPIAIG
jgi:hypothetical protein